MQRFSFATLLPAIINRSKEASDADSNSVMDDADKSNSRRSDAVRNTVSCSANAPALVLS